MKKITLYLKDETVEALDKAVESCGLYNYPKEQAYSIYIDELVSDIQKLPQYALMPYCWCILEHRHPLVEYMGAEE